jgi:adenylate cyclase
MGAVRCAACGHRMRAAAKFCEECGASAQPPRPAERKHVTVLFGDVVGSMKLAATLDPELLREIMYDLFNRSALIVQRYGGTVDKFTGDGLMALFGAPVALEDHALRAAFAALEIHTAAAQLATRRPPHRPRTDRSLLEQPRHPPVREHLATGLTGRAVLE